MTQMTDIQIIEQKLLPADMAKVNFSANFVKLLFAKHQGIKPEYIWDFLHKAQKTGADPVTGQIMLTPRKVKNKDTNQWETVGVVVFSYGYTLGIVQQHPQFAGLQSEIKIVERLRFKKAFDDRGKEYLDLSSEPSQIKEMACVSTIWRGDKPYTYTAFLSDYYAKGNPQWLQMPETMLRKCAEVACARHSFADCIQGFYTPEEFDKEENVEAEAIKTVEVLAQEVKTEKTLEAHKITNYDEQGKLLNDIKEAMGILTNGKSLTEKAKFMTEFLGVERFDDLKKSNNEFLKKTLEELNTEIDLMNATNNLKKQGAIKNAN